MAEKPTAMHVLGLELACGEIRGAKLSRKKRKATLDNLFSIPIPKTEEADVKPLYIQSTGKSLNDIAKHYLIATAITPNDVLVRSLDLSLKKTKDIDAVLAFQAEPVLPYPVENAALDRIILAQNENGTQLTLLAAKKDRVNTFIEQWNHYHIEPEVVTCVPAALASFGLLLVPTKTDFYIIHLSKTQTVCVLVKEGKLSASQTCSKNLGSLEAAWQEDSKIKTGEVVPFNQVPWDSLNKEENPVLAETLEQLKQELIRTLFSLEKQNKGKEIPEILVTGECGEHYDLVFHLGEALNKRVITPEVPATFNAPLPQVLKFAIPIGTALGSLVQTPDPVNFRQDDLAYPAPWKRLKKPISIYLSLCIATSIALFFFGNAYIKLKEDEVRADYTNLLMVMQKPHTSFEKEFRNSPEEQSFSLKNISISELRERIAVLEKELSSTPDIFPLLPNILTVSDVLAWLNTQPTVIQIDPKTKKTTPLIQIDNFSYSMIKRPEITKNNERYQVKVELEFSSPTPKEAREFHDALIAPNSLVDPKGEVKWSTNRGKYKASFFLKDKTVYPTTH